MTDNTPATPGDGTAQTYPIRRYEPGDEVTITTDHGTRTGRVTAYGPDHTYAVQFLLPEDEISSTDPR